MSDKQRLVFVHLSDIHLRKEEIQSVLDLDEDIRNEVKLDLGRRLSGVEVNGLLVTGDLAFAGKPEEYVSAGEWLEELCYSLRCPVENVWMVPGNHDVDRSAVQTSAFIQMARKRLRELPEDQIDAEFARLLRDREARLLFQPIRAYNDFAKRYECESTASSIGWTYDFQLNDTSRLRLVGLNSILLSDSRDNRREHKLLVGTHQLQLKRQNDVAYVSLCHHPSDWLLDGDDVQDWLNSRAAVQLYGHKHRQRLNRIDNSVVLSSGALHPSRSESNWQPRYNILRLHVDGGGDERVLVVEVDERQWAMDIKEFVSAPRSPRTFEIELPTWIPRSEGQADIRSGGAAAPGSSSAGEPAIEEGDPMHPSRQLVHRFFSMSFPKRMSILTELDLLEPEDEQLSEELLIVRAFERARERGQVEKLQATVDNYYKG